MIKIWVDDVRPKPEGYDLHLLTVEGVNEFIAGWAFFNWDDEGLLLDLDHDAGDYAKFGGDYIEILNWMESEGYGPKIKFKLHTMNPVGRFNMLNIIKRNRWEII